jgi:hypothetical protein
MAQLLSIGHGTTPMLDGTPWPYEVSISYDHPDYPIAMSEGIGHAAVGGFFRAEEILEPQWQEHLAICKCEWLVTVVRQARAAGTRVTAAMLEAAWRAAS